VGILLVVAVIAILIVVHEFGHFIVAKLFGVGVSRFSVGFGKVLFGKKLGETEYCMSLIPLGGYVKFVDDEKHVKKPESKLFEGKPAWQRILICLAGPGFNVLFGMILLIFMVHVTPIYSSKVDVIPGSPAEMTGIQKGDIIVKIDGIEISTWKDVLVTMSSNTEGNPVEIVIAREKSVHTYVIKPELKDERWVIGILATKSEIKKELFQSIVEGVKETRLVLKKMAYLFHDLFSGEIPIDESVGGPVRIVQIGTQVQEQSGAMGLIWFTVVISFNLALLNLLPLPVLDGGQIVFLSIEMILRRPIKKSIQIALMNFTFFLLVALIILITINDVMHLF
jgi:regulator of sigma E protease